MNNNKTITMKKVLFILVAALVYEQPAQALTFELDSHTDIVGEIQYYTVDQGDTLFGIAHHFDVGIAELHKANPKINPNRLVAGTTLIVPTQFILPPGPRTGMVINLAELRVYYYPKNENTVITHPIGIGRSGWLTPVGQTTIVDKRKDPVWTPPPSIRAYSAAKGIILPEVWPAGPTNPLGAYAMNFGWNRYVMHGTNAPISVGQRSSSGCIRMYAEDIENMFENVPIGTKVRFIYEPFKVGVKNNDLYLEAHEMFPESYYQQIHGDRYELLKEVVYQVDYSGRSDINWDRAKDLVRRTHGYPVSITGGSVPMEADNSSVNNSVQQSTHTPSRSKSSGATSALPSS